MAINKFYIKKWFRMITGKSILHVNQSEGKYYEKNIIRGYYNDLREKVLKSSLAENELPLTELPDGRKIEFSIAIFQYGLGAYDLFIETNDDIYLNRFNNSVNWALKHLDENGGWVTFEENNNPYSAMAQGEGISLLSRAYQINHDKKILNCMNLALKLLIKDECDGGCAQYEGKSVRFKEYPLKNAVLNGWIFSAFGIYDYLLIKNDKNVKKIFNYTVETIEKDLLKYDLGYWSKYDDGEKIASPFYHKLHISLLKVLYILTEKKDFLLYSEKFELYTKNYINRIKAFVKKSFQKILE